MVLWVVLALAVLTRCAQGFDLSCKSNLALYWGQNSYGASHPSDPSNWEKPLGEYCDDDTVDVFVLSFLHIFNAGDDRLPGTNFANHCNTTFANSDLLHCPHFEADIKKCQAKGKKVLLSLGGAAGSYGFANDNEAVDFAQTVWDLFMGGESDNRPFGEAVLDGIDLDIEGGSSVGYSAFVDALRQKFILNNATGQRYYVAAAPQCPYPDAYLDTVLSTSWVDMVFVQFYNNYCGVNNYPRAFNFDEWQQWADTKAVNEDVSIFMGIPGSSTAASMGYIEASRLQTIIQEVQPKYRSFGGVMMWDASQSYNNRVSSGNYATFAKQELNKLDQCGASQPPTPSETTSKPDTPATTTSEVTTPITITTTTTADAPVTTTTTTSVPEPVTTHDPTEPQPPADGCIEDGSPCGTEHRFLCQGYNYAECVHGQWLVRPCSVDKSTACYPLGTSGIYCDFPNGRLVETCPEGAHALGQLTTPASTDVVTTTVQTEVFPDHRFRTLITMRARDNAPIRGHWRLAINLPDGQTLVSANYDVSKGASMRPTSDDTPYGEASINVAASTTGDDHSLTLFADLDEHPYMAMYLVLEGRYSSQQPYVALQAQDVRPMLDH
ncbi:Chitinase 2 [Dimargaris verticillata]|uniref:chitinase n=1 Tax=Dimargaris verticillata TaxID=2761393 RepID=A0A9W8B6S7_9FUNG|nr:Chitinase 2 [Dimargaris verticillata]